VSDKDDDLQDTVSAMADRLGLKGKERQGYIHEHMTRSGYRAVPTYVLDDQDDEDDEEDSGGFFRGSSRRDRDRDDSDRPRRSSGERRRGPRSGDDWYS
jgi:hypothetical protein